MGLAASLPSFAGDGSLSTAHAATAVSEAKALPAIAANRRRVICIGTLRL